MERVGRSPVARAVLVVAAVTAVAGVARFYHLGSPGEKVFDEVYYASDGCLFAGLPFEECGLERNAEVSWVHPPAGKYLIAWGVDGFGNRPLGWRVSAAAAGTATVALAGALGFLLSRRALWAGVAALLLAAEHLNFVQSRVAMLDIFLALFVLLGFVLLVWDKVRRDRRDALLRPVVAGGSDWAGWPPGTPGGGRGEEDPPDPSASPPAAVDTLVAGPVALRAAAPPGVAGPSGLRPLRLLAGAALGLSVATKWSGIFALAAAAALAVGWETTRRRRAGAPRLFRRALAEEGASLALAFVVVPAVAYTLTWLPWLSDHGWSLGDLYRNHRSIADYHLGLTTLDDRGEPIHPYMSRAWTWLLLARPVAYFYEGGTETASEILGIGNPLLFWGALVVVPYLALQWRGSRDWRAGAILVPILLQYVPWLFVTRPLFLFYMTPVTPFLALGLTSVLRDLATARRRDRVVLAPAAGLVVAVGVGLFVFFWPVLVGDTISLAAWRDRIWFGSWV